MPTQAGDQHERRIAQIQNKLAQLQASVRVVMNAEELVALEHEIHEITNRLAAALLEQKVQASLDSDEMTECMPLCWMRVAGHLRTLYAGGELPSRHDGGNVGVVFIALSPIHVFSL